MGGADIVPGVSGGTVALILGIYSRLVGAISQFNGRLLSLLTRRNWREAAVQVDLRFLIFLGAGILTGVVALASIVHMLLADHRQETYAAFFGLIVVSGFLVARMAGKWRVMNGIVFATACAVAFWLVGLEHLQSPPDSLLYLFFCGMVGICAMILPGISGAFLLLILGRYETVTGILKNLKSFDVTIFDLISLVVFAAGCVVGLLAFSRILKWLLAKHFNMMMTVLCGLMFGSLRVLWPFQKDLTPDVEKLKLKQYAIQEWSELSWTGDVLPVITIAIIAGLFVFLLDRFTGTSRRRNLRSRNPQCMRRYENSSFSR